MTLFSTFMIQLQDLASMTWEKTKLSTNLKFKSLESPKWDSSNLIANKQSLTSILKYLLSRNPPELLSMQSPLVKVDPKLPNKQLVNLFSMMIPKTLKISPLKISSKTDKLLVLSCPNAIVSEKRNKIPTTVLISLIKTKNQK